MIGKAGNFGQIPYKHRQTRTPETADRSPPIGGDQTTPPPFSLFPLLLFLLDLCKHRFRLVLRPSCRSQVEQSSGRGSATGGSRRMGERMNESALPRTNKQSQTKATTDPGHLPDVHNGFSSALFACRSSASRGYHGKQTEVTTKAVTREKNMTRMRQ